MTPLVTPLFSSDRIRRLAQLLVAFVLAALIAFIGLTFNTRSNSQGSASSAVRIAAVSTLMTERTSETIPAGPATKTDSALAQQMLARSDWQPSALPIAKGWTRQIAWARLSIENTSDTAQDVWLEVAPARLRWIALHQIGVAGLDAAEQMQTSGVAIAASDRSIAAPDIVFPLRLQAREKRVVLLQAQSNTSALDFTAALHDPKKFAAHASDSTDLLLIGGTFALGLLSLAAGLALRQPLQLLLGVRSLLISVWLLQQLGVLSLLLSAQMAAFWADQVRLAAVSTLILTTAFMWLFLSRITMSQRKPLPRAMHACFAILMALATAGSLALLFNLIHGAQAAVIFGILTWGTLLFTLSLSCYLVWKGHVAALTLIVTSTASLLLNSQAYLSLLGISGNVIRQFISPIPVLITTAVFFVGATLQLAREQRDRQQAEKEALQRAMAQLEGLVGERTQDLQLARDQAEKANAAKTVFMAKVSHELRTPMHSLLGYVNLALREQLTEPVERKLRIARRSGEQLVAQISDLLDYVRMERDEVALQSKVFSLSGLCESAEERALLLTAQGGNQLLSQRDPALPEYLLGDDARIEQILMILLTNAMRYTQGGVVRFDVSLVLLPQTATQNLNSSGQCAVRFSVSDTGRGISPEALQQLFLLFERGQSSDSDGMGLGLPIAKQLLTLMGSELEVSSEIGRGSRFAFTLQLALPHAEQQPQSMQTSGVKQAQAMPTALSIQTNAPGANAAKRLLLLEDDVVSAQYLQEILQANGFEVVAAHSLAAAINAVKNDEQQGTQNSAHSAFDAFITDQHLGLGTSGWDFVRHLQQCQITAPVIMISALEPQCPQDAAPAVASGIAQHLMKPFSDGDLLAALARVLINTKLVPTISHAAWAQLQTIAQSGLVTQLSAWRSEHAHIHGDVAKEHAELWPMFDALRFSSIAAYAQVMQK